MGVKTLEVQLKLGLGNFTAGLGAASAQVKAFGTGLNEAVPEHTTTKLDKLGSAALVTGGLLAAGLGLAAKSAMDFDKQLSELQAVSGATGEAMDALRQQAIDAGAATVFSAGEAAQAQVELAKAGVSTADILGGALTGALNLASAGGLDLADAAAIAAQTMTTFGLAGKDVGRIADALAAGANKSAADVSQLAQGLQQSGLVANQFGLTMEETVGTLSLFSQNALNGSDAGTSLKTMLLRLGAPTGEAKDLMEQLGIAVYDSAGNINDFADIADSLQVALSGMSDEQRNAAMTTLFGSDAIRAANILYKEGGDGVRDWTDAVSEQGYAAELAAKKTDNLAGDLEALGGSFETALIGSGENAQGMLRSLTQTLTDLVNGFAAIGPGGQKAMTVLAGVGAAALLLIGGVIKLRTAIIGLGLASESLSFTPIFAAVAAAGLVVGVFAKHLIDSGRAAAEAKSRVDAYVQAAGDVTDALGAQKFAASNAAKIMDDLGLSWDGFREAIEDTEQPFARFRDNAAITADLKPFDSIRDGLEQGSVAMDTFNDDLLAAAASGNKFAVGLKAMVDAGTITASQANEIATAIAQQSDAQIEANRQNEIAAAIDPKSADGKKQIAAAAEEAAQKVDELKDAIDRLIGVAYDEQQAVTAIHREMNGVTDDAKAFVEAGGNMANVMTSNSDEALALQDDLADLADTHADLIKVWIDQGVTGKDLADRVNFLAQGMYQFAISQGYPEAAAAKLRDTLLSIPAQVQSQVGTPGATGAILNIADLQARLDRLGGAKAYPEVAAAINAGSFDAANRALNALAAARTVTLTVKTIQQKVLGAFGFAGGGIVAAAAGGRLDIRRGAEIARPGRVRWNEPDTHGEAYIPFAGDWRRPNAQSVWLEAGKRIGMLPSQSAAGMAAQSWAGVPAGSAGISVTLAPQITIPNYVGSRAELTRAIESALQSATPSMKAAVAQVVRQTGRQ